MKFSPEKFAGGVPSRPGGNGEVSNEELQGCSGVGIFTPSAPLPVQVPHLASVKPEDEHDSEDLRTGNCDRLPARGQKIGERGGGLARRRYQQGRLFLRGKKNPVWVGRWREDEINDGCIRRAERSEVLGSKSDFPTKRLAQRELDKRLAVVNDPRYRARPTATFAELYPVGSR